MSWPRWALAYAAALASSALLATLTGWGGNAAFIAGALVILASVGFVRTGSEARFHVVRDLFYKPVAVEPQDPTERQQQISTGMRIFLLGIAMWAPLVVIALR